jgi:8-oxo-dGTP pyrophosphatase MutT (NUDIX family)
MRQFAALPVATRQGVLHVLLVTSRETHRWIIPKGRPEKRLTPAEVARLEAFEEAGVRGVIQRKPIGVYRSTKRLPSGAIVPTKVRVFVLKVAVQLDVWPEQHQRERQWANLPDAIGLVSEPGLAALLTAMAV